MSDNISDLVYEDEDFPTGFIQRAAEASDESHCLSLRPVVCPAW
jgi:hypothetical protein